MDLTEEEKQKLREGLRLIDSFNKVGRMFKYFLYAVIGLKLMSVFIFEDITSFFKAVMNKIV